MGDPSDDKERAKSWSPKCQSLNKPIWSSEESSSFDNLNGAACWARIISSHYILNNITSNIMWNLVGSYMHGTNWYASSLLTANQPWSNYYEYETMPVLWATAHYTQFTNPGWRFLPQHKGSGQLPKGGYYVTLISPCRKYFTMIVVKISRDHAPCTRPALFNYDTSDEIFNISFKGFSGDSKVQIWYSNFENEKAVLFQQISQAESTLKNNVFSTSLNVTIGSLFTITNFPKMGVKGIPKHRFKSDPKFPLSYYDDFSKNYKCTNCYAKYLTDQTGSFEIQKNINDSSKALVQTTPKKPLGWVWIGTGPVSIIGMFEWEDIQAKTKFRLPLKQQHIGACLALRTDQNWNHGVSLCVNSTHWFINKGGPPIDDLGKGNVLQKGKINSVLKPYSWNEILIATENSNLIKAELNGISLIEKKINIGNGCGFAGLGVTSFAPVEFQDLKIDPVGSRWIKKNDIINNFKNDELHVGFKPCTPNGLTTDQEEFILTSNWQLLNKATNKCVTVIQKNQLVLKPCKHNYMPQQFRHDYTTVRNAPNELKNEKGQICASLQKNKGSLKICNDTADKDYTIQKFVALPNTNQIRHVYHDGLAMCISIIEKIDGNIELKI